MTPTPLTRRHFFGAAAASAATATGLGAFGSPSPTGAQTAAGAAEPLQGAGFYRFPLGDKTLTVLAEGSDLFPGQPLFAPDADPAAFAAVQRDGFEAEDRVNFHMNTLLVETGDRRILIDAGPGGFLGPRFDRQSLALAHAGVDPASIDTVIITHGHADHFGGLVDADLRPRFPNAEVIWQAGEWAFWTSPEAVSITRASRMPTELIDTFIRTTQAVLPASASQNRLVEGEQEIAPGVTLLPAPGHTPHSAVVLISDGDQQLLYASDTTLLPRQNALRPEWTSVFEPDPAAAVATRRRLLDRAAADGIAWFGYHAPFPALGRIRAAGDAWEFVPTGWRW